MSKQDETLHSGAAQYFHNASNNWNCAQSIIKHKQALLGLSDEAIELHYRSKGGGRAEGGLCGALYASLEVLGPGQPERRERLLRDFEREVGGTTCARIKGRCGRGCLELVTLSERLLERELEDLKENGEGI